MHFPSVFSGAQKKLPAAGPMSFSPLRRRDGGGGKRLSKNGVMFHTTATATVDYDEDDEEEVDAMIPLSPVLIKGENEKPWGTKSACQRVYSYVLAAS